MNSPSVTPVTSKPQTALGRTRVVLQIKGLGPVPSLKNHKRSVMQKNGKAKPITDPAVKDWMRKAIMSFVSQLLWASVTAEGETRTGASLRSWIASSVPVDDCWTCMPQMIIECELCEPGQEGATITIDRIDA